MSIIKFSIPIFLTRGHLYSDNKHEWTVMPYDQCLSVICLSNGIELQTNHADSFIMSDTVSGYYFKAVQKGKYIFGKAGKKIAVLCLLKSNEANQTVISIKNSSNKERICHAAFFEIRRNPYSGDEYIWLKQKRNMQEKLHEKNNTEDI